MPDEEAKISFVKNKVLEKMKRTVRRQSVSGSVGSGISRASSKTRQRSEDDQAVKEPAPNT